MEYVAKTIKAKVVALTKIKRAMIESEYNNYQKAILLSEELIEELNIKSLKQATNLLYRRNSKYSLTKRVSLYSATYQTAYTRALFARNGKFKKEQPLRLRNDTFSVRKTDKEIATYWSKIPIYGKRGGVKVALKISPKHEELLQNPDIQICDSELLKRDGDFYLHITIKKCIDITPRKSDKLAVIGIDVGIRNTAVSVVWRDNSITGVKIHSGRKLKHKVEWLKAKLAKFHRHAFKHNSYHCVVKALDRISKANRKWREYTLAYLHKISREIINEAITLRDRGYDVLIACESLKGIRNTMSGKLHWWAFRKFLSMLKYKARWEGIPYIEVDAANTSRICPRCNNYDKQSRDGLSFICHECKYSANADLVGAMNVATRSLDFLELYALGNGCSESTQEVVSTEPQAVRLSQTQSSFE